MKVTAEVTHDQLVALLARQLKVEPAAVTLAADEHGHVSAHVATDNKRATALERKLRKLMEPESAEAKPNGFTLVEVMIVIAMLGIGIASLGLLGGGCGGSKAAIEQEARDWAAELGIGVTAVSCIGADNDNDGYVSCTIMTTDGQRLPVECVGGLGWGEGCRTPKMSIPSQRLGVDE